MRPRLLDLFCGAGGAAMGYHRAGFEVIGVDHRPQPRYPFEFIEADALEFCAEHGAEYQAIHASPPCQAYSAARTIHPGRSYPDLVAPTREALQMTGRPYVIENVPGAPLVDAILLCGAMFPPLRTYRHRLFECSFRPLQTPLHPRHKYRCALIGRNPGPDEWMSVCGNGGKAHFPREAMGIDWMNRTEISQAIPPVYTEYIGKKLINFLER